MICPFRVEERFKYTNLDDKALVIESKTEKNLKVNNDWKNEI